MNKFNSSDNYLMNTSSINSEMFIKEEPLQSRQIYHTENKLKIESVNHHEEGSEICTNVLRPEEPCGSNFEKIKVKQEETFIKAFDSVIKDNDYNMKAEIDMKNEYFEDLNVKNEDFEDLIDVKKEDFEDIIDVKNEDFEDVIEDQSHILNDGVIWKRNSVDSEKGISNEPRSRMEISDSPSPSSSRLENGKRNIFEQKNEERMEEGKEIEDFESLKSKMVRNFKKKTDRANIDEHAVASAIKSVLEENMSIRKAAAKYNLKASTLQHRVEKQKRQVEEKNFFSKYCSQQVFTVQQENELNKYIVIFSKMHYGLTMLQVRNIAYEYAKKVNSKYPPKWDETKMTGIDWLSGFRKRNNISLRKPENTSVARSFGFSRSAVEEFYGNYIDVLTQYKCSPDRIINFDETGITTVISTPKVLADKAQKQVGQIVSGERGELVTFCGIISAIGNAIPPVLIFPRVHYKDHFLNGGPEGSLGLAAKSGWMNADLYLETLKHIQKHTSSCKENKILLLCDNHESHSSIEAIDYCRENGIVYLSFPPHTSHKLQPLDVAVFGPFKRKLKIAFNDWHLNNPGKTITIYEIPRLAKLAYQESFTTKNISQGFAKPGIHPLKKLSFSDDDFAPCNVYSSNAPTVTTHNASTDSGNCTSPLAASSNTQRQNGQMALSLDNRMATEILSPEPQPSTFTATIISSETIRPIPKIGQRLVKRKGRERGKSRIYTDTPEKDRLQDLNNIKEQKKLVKEQKERAKELKNARNLLAALAENSAGQSRSANKRKRTISNTRYSNRRLVT